MQSQISGRWRQQAIGNTLRCAAVVMAGVMALAGLAASPAAAQSVAKPLTLVPGRSDGAVQPDGGRYALVIGIDDYSDDLNRHGTSDLKYSVKGARAVADALVRYGGFPPNHVQLLLDGQATHDAILTYLASLRDAGMFPGGEMFLLYFCGHGMLFDTHSDDPSAPGQRDNVLVPVDGSNLEALAASHNISLMEVLQDLHRAANFPRQIVLLDACRSVETLEGAKGFSAPPGFDFNFSLYKPYATGRLIFSSSSPGQRSWEDPQLQDGVFTHFLLQALTKTPGAGNADGVVTMGSLEDYVSSYVADWSRQHPGQAQTPQPWGEGDPAMPLTLVQRTGALTARQQAQQLQGQALALENAGRRDEALGLLLQAAQADPTWAEASFEAGYVYQAQQRFAEAIAEYQTAIRLDPQFAMPHNNLGNVYDDQKRYDEAIAEYQTAIRLDPQDAYPHNNLGKVYDDQKRYEEAIAEYKTAIRLDPQFANPHNNLGKVYYEQQRYDEALAEYQTAIRLDPQYASPHNNLGLVYKKQQRYDEAITEFKTAIRLDPKFADAHYNLGMVYKTQQRYDEAIAEFRQGGALAPNDPDYAKQIEATQAAKTKAGK